MYISASNPIKPPKTNFHVYMRAYLSADCSRVAKIIQGTNNPHFSIVYLMNKIKEKKKSFPFESVSNFLEINYHKISTFNIWISWLI